MAGIFRKHFAGPLILVLAMAATLVLGFFLFAWLGTLGRHHSGMLRGLLHSCELFEEPELSRSNFFLRSESR